jgi:hypothetical protein
MAGRGRFWLAAVAAASVAAAPVGAVASPCWAPDAIDAARVQQFETMLMSVSLRCRTTGVDLAGHFERFRDTHKVRLEHVLAVLGEHYGVGRTPQGKRDLDHFVIQLANAFGGGRSDLPTCQSFAAVLAELNGTAEAQNALETFAFAMVRDPFLDAPRCGVAGTVNGPPASSGGSPTRR